MRILPLLIFIISSFYSVAQDNATLLKHLQKLSSDEMEGRGFGTRGNTQAQEYIAEQFNILDLMPAFNDSYLESFIHDNKIGNNIVAIIPGTIDSIIVITAHYDHLGIKNGKIYNGADDNASGVAALFAIAKHLKTKTNRHTFVIAAVDAEEIGSIGAQYLLDHFPKPSKNIILNINLDMVAHNDNNELYACGTYFYPHLKAPLEHLDSEITLKFGHDSPAYNGADNWTFSSDHRVFHRKNIPFIYFGVEDHEDYHQPSDTFENINTGFYINAVDLIIKAIDNIDQYLSKP